MAGINFIPNKPWMIFVRDDEGASVEVRFDMVQKFISDQTEITRKLGDPDAVYYNMLSGNIAKISMSQCAHLHGAEMLELWNAFLQQTRRSDEERSDTASQTAETPV